MNIFLNIWNNWSTYEKVQELILLLSIPLVSILAIYLSSKNKRILIFSSIMFVISILINILGVVLVNLIFDIQVTEVFRLIPILTYMLILSNLGVLIGFFIHKRDRKGFDINDIKREYLSDSTKQTIFLLLLGSSILMFVSVQTQSILIISILSCIISIWGTYGISRYIFK